MIREQLQQAMHDGIVHETGLIAHGRGEAFDYLIGEQTIPSADEAARTSAAALVLAKNPVISVNGNVATLAGRECVALAKYLEAKLEVNLFHRTAERMNKISELLKQKGAKQVYGFAADARIPGLDHNRARCDHEGIYTSDVVLVPLEDGDRCQALKQMKKTVIAIDLNPLSRTANTASITIVDNLIRALPNIHRWSKELQNWDSMKLKQIVQEWDNMKLLTDSIRFVSKRLNSLS
jgi:4-phosphopantoate--beta-alanine ligase